MKPSFLRTGVDAIMRMSSTRANYWAEFGVDSALCLLLLVLGWRLHAGGVLTALLALGLGLFAFSFIEYFFHRWMFHTRIPLFAQGHAMHHQRDRKSVVKGKRVSVRVDLGGRRLIKKKKKSK